MLQIFVVEVFLLDLHISNLDFRSTSVFSGIISVHQLNPQYALLKRMDFIVEADVIKRSS